MGSFVVVLREGFEASLVLGLIFAYLRKTEQRQHAAAVWAGASAALVASVAIGAMLFAAVGELEGTAEKAYEGCAMLLAVVVLTWMVFWMRRQARTIGGHLRSQVSEALLTGGGIALASVAFVAVGREGLETALFLFASVGDSGLFSTLVGGALGFVGAVALGVLFYRGTVKLDLKRFFLVTSVLVIGLAAYLLAGALHELGEAGLGDAAEVAGPIAGALYGIAFAALYVRGSRAARPAESVSAEAQTS